MCYDHASYLKKESPLENHPCLLGMELGERVELVMGSHQRKERKRMPAQL